MGRALELIRRLETNVGRALVGKPEVVRLAVIGLVARGHLLIEDVPRVGKTTHPFPGSQLGRFRLRIRIGYPSVGDEKTILRGTGVPSADALDPVLAVEDVLHLQGEAERVHAEEPILDYVMALVAATRASPLLPLGVSPRGALALLRAARAWALADGRDFLVPDDVKALAIPALAHRVLVRGATGRPSDGGGDAESVIRAIAHEVPVPR